ncbi:DgyrCDS12222 [Dimorphilus gyrociliatus]|uniref:DgyrCDS12222 n=1 Tax=Dimorphilus gyrociliatus TaxID=2664684 RepID=A0A7I8W6N3_9ANNE|nr:DgyrCDS12222 [Dimorphilus gyrociliatus]
MMEESDQDVQQIASQLEEAALTNVTEAHSSGGLAPPVPLPNLSTATSPIVPSAAMTQMPPIPQMTPELRPTVTPASMQQPNSTTPTRVTNTKDITPPPPVSGFVPTSKTIAASLPTSGVYSQNSPAPAPPTFVPETQAAGPQTSLGSSYGQNVDVTAQQIPVGGAPAQFSPPPMQSPYQASQAIDFTAVPDNNARESLQSDSFLGGWFSGNFMTKVVEKAKHASETVITTLDPGMKQVLSSSGYEISLLVSSSDGRLVEAIRQGFQSEFQTMAKGYGTFSISAVQIIGQSAALKSIEQKIDGLRKSNSSCQLFVAFDSFLAEQLPDQWFDLGVLHLRDDARNINLTTFTPAFPVGTEDVLRAQDMTPATYDLRWSGLAISIEEIMRMRGPVSADWRKDLFGSGIYETVANAAKSLAFMYKKRICIQ